MPFPSEKKGILALVFFSLGLYAMPFFLHWDGMGLGDWDVFSFFNAVPRKTLVEYQQIPLWNPYSSGGRPLWANPQDGMLRPTYFWILLLGVQKGLKVEWLFMLVLGYGGMFLLSRYLSLSLWGSLLSASLFSFSTFFSLHLAEGHVHFSGFYLLPWLFLFYLKSVEKRFPYLLLASLVVLWILAGGGTGHILIPTSLFWALHAVLVSWQKKEKKYLLHLFAIFALAGLWGAAKLLPIYEYMHHHPRPASAKEYLPLKGLYSVYLDRDQILIREGSKFSPQFQYWHEYGAYTGILPIIFFLCGLFLFFKKEYPWILPGLVCFFLALGNFAFFSPWQIIHYLPVFSSTQVPFRYVIFFIFALSLVNGKSMDFFIHRYKSKKGKIFFSSLALVIIADLLWVNFQVLHHAFPAHWPEQSRQGPFYQFYDEDRNRSGSYSSMCLNLQENRGTLNGYDPVPHRVYPRGLGREDYKGEIYLLKSGTVEYLRWSPNILSFRISTPTENLVVVNQNYDGGWRAEGNFKVVSKGGLLAVEVPSFQGEVVLYYSPFSWKLGLLLSGISMVLTLVWIGRRRWKKSP